MPRSRKDGGATNAGAPIPVDQGGNVSWRQFIRSAKELGLPLSLEGSTAVEGPIFGKLETATGLSNTYVPKTVAYPPRIQDALPPPHPNPPTITYFGANTGTGISGSRAYLLAGASYVGYAGNTYYATSPSMLFGGTQAFLSKGTDFTGNQYIGGTNQTGNEIPFWYFSFYTDAPSFELTYQGSVSPSYRLLVDGMTTTLNSAVAGFGGSGVQNRMVVTFATRKFRSITVESSSLFVSQLVVRAIDTVIPRNPQRIMAFMGDSYLLNGGSDVGIGPVAARICGCDWLVNGSGGTGYNNSQSGTGGKQVFIDRLPQLLASIPPSSGYLVTAGGINDGTGTLAADVAAYLALAKQTLAPGRIFVTGAWNPPSSPGATKSAIIKTATLAAGVQYVDNIAGAWQSGTGNTSSLQGDGNSDLYVGSDNTHPFAPDGYAYVGTRLGIALASLIGA